MGKPTEKPKEPRPSKSSHSSASTSSECPRQPKHVKRADAVAAACNAEKYVTITTKISDEPGGSGKMQCTYSGGKSAGGQACLHYCGLTSMAKVSMLNHEQLP